MKRIQAFLGTWQYDIDTKASPFGPAGKMTGTDRIEAGPGGFSVDIDASAGKKIKGRNKTTFTSATAYTWTFEIADDKGVFARGGRSGDQTVTLINKVYS